MHQQSMISLRIVSERHRQSGSSSVDIPRIKSFRFGPTTSLFSSSFQPISTFSIVTGEHGVQSQEISRSRNDPAWASCSHMLAYTSVVKQNHLVSVKWRPRSAAGKYRQVWLSGLVTGESGK